MFNFITNFTRKAAMMVQPTVTALASAVPPGLTNQCQTGARFFTNVTRRFGMITQVLLRPDYYDPYVQKEHAEYLRINGIEEDFFAAEQAPVKTQYRSLAFCLLSDAMRWFSYNTTKILTGYEHHPASHFEEAVEAAREKKTICRERHTQVASLIQLPVTLQYPLQQAGERFRRIFPRKQHHEDQDPLLQARFFPPLAMEAYRQALDDEKNAWGIVAGDNLTVHFIQPFAPPTFPPPPKPARGRPRQSPAGKKQDCPTTSRLSCNSARDTFVKLHS